MSLSAALRHFGDFGSQDSFVCDVKDDEDDFPLIELDSEVRTCKTEFETELKLGSRRFERFSSFLLSKIPSEQFV
jgi:hypothetical protein